MLFGELLTGSNYNDNEKKVTGGRNGYGAKLTNIFSDKFIIVTADIKRKKVFKMIWENNMNKKSDPYIRENIKDEFT
jgi:DNA topoisomerase-2